MGGYQDSRELDNGGGAFCGGVAVAFHGDQPRVRSALDVACILAVFDDLAGDDVLPGCVHRMARDDGQVIAGHRGVDDSELYEYHYHGVAAAVLEADARVDIFA